MHQAGKTWNIVVEKIRLTASHLQPAKSTEGSPRSWLTLPQLPLFIAGGITLLVTIVFGSALTNQGFIFSSSEIGDRNCQTKLNGKWQTNWGNMSFQEEGGSAKVKGKYEYQNLDRGKVKGEITGTLNADVLNFDWQETTGKNQAKQQGKGSLLFRNNCKDFFGSYGLNNNDTGLGNWRGTVLQVTPIGK